MKLNANLLYFGIVVIILLSSCKHDSLPLTPNPSGISYSRDIAPIMNTYCSYSGCHNSDNTGNFPLENYTEVVNYGQVFPFDPEGSDLYQVLTNGYMPLGDSLPPRDKQLIYDWIENGALNN